MFDKTQLSSYATEYIIGDYGIWESYNYLHDLHNHGHPHPKSKSEPLFRISNVWEKTCINKRRCWDKSEGGFVYLCNPSSRSDEDLVNQSFTLEEAYALVKRLNQGET
jgi:hypothetical protein